MSRQRFGGHIAKGIEMDAQPPVFSGTLKVRACHVLWTKTPVQLTYHRQDYRHALPVLLIRRPGVLGGEFRVPLDPCIHPVRLLPVSRKMAAKLEFALEYGWHTRQVRLRAPDASTYRQWTSLVSAALESGRRPLASCTSTTRGGDNRSTVHDLECSSLASTLNSSSNAKFNITLRRKVPEKDEEEEDETVQQHFFSHLRPAPSDFFVLHEGNSRPASIIHDDFQHPSWALDSPSSAPVGSCSCFKVHGCLWPSLRIRFSSAAITHELFLQARVWFMLL
ncbi:RxLR effector candidate protein [Phytophthora cinnamomi]|uniref:RxLR effector candidate protein n=1 Tax=Phytophthora cinnamomi TaxID=4785 RepID=UPI00355A7FA1|nr:RxLR effector candidate protein [Phytophthora cinnamomi]